MGLIKLKEIISKNFKQIMRARLSSLIILIGPVLIILLAGFVLNSSGLEGVSIGMSNNLDDTLNTQVEKSLSSRGLNTLFYSNQESCIQSVRAGENHVCLYIEEKVNKSQLSFIDERYDHNISISVDYSKTRIIWSVLNEINIVLESKSKEITYTLFNDLSYRISNTLTELEDKQSQIQRALNLVDNLGSHLEDLESEVIQVQELSDEMRSNLNDLENDVSLLTNSASQISGGNPEIVNLGALIISEISIINENLDLMDESLESSWIQTDSLQRQTSELKTNLIRIEDSISGIALNFQEFKELTAEDLMEPIKPNYYSVSGDKSNSEEELNYFDYILPILILIVVMFSSILIGSTNTLREKKNKAYTRNILSPTSTGTFLMGNFLSALVTISIQISILLLIAKFYFFSAIDLQGINVILLLLMTSSLFIFMGILIGHLFSSEESALIASISLGILFLITSSMIMSVESLPFVFGKFFSLTPFLLIEDLLRKLMIFQLNLSDVFVNMVFLSGYILVFFILASIMQNKTKYKETS